MSRIGKMPIALPAGVTVDFKDGVVTVKGPKGTLTREVVGNIGIETEGATLLVKALDDKADTNAKQVAFAVKRNTRGVKLNSFAVFKNRKYHYKLPPFAYAPNISPKARSSI